MGEVDPETLLEWLQSGAGEERDMQLIALEQEHTSWHQNTFNRLNLLMINGTGIKEYIGVYTGVVIYEGRKMIFGLD